MIADPEAMTSPPEPRLRASSMNALAHGADSLYTPFANPVSRMTALRGAELIATALDQERESATAPPWRSARSSAATRSTPACSRSTTSSARPWSASAAARTRRPTPRSCRGRWPSWPRGRPPRSAALAAAIGTDPDRIEARILELGGNPPGLGAVGADRERLDEAVEAILERPELGFTPSPPSREELIAR